MRMRHVGVFVLLLLLAVLAVANWQTIVAPTVLNVLVAQIQAPLGLLMFMVVGVMTVTYALLLILVERRLLRESTAVHRELEEQRKRGHESQAVEVRELAQTVTRDLSEIRSVLGRLVSQSAELRVLVAGRVGARQGDTPGEPGGT